MIVTGRPNVSEYARHRVVGRGLRGVVRRPRPVRRLLRERVSRVERQVAVDLARRDVVKARHPAPARGLEQRLRPEDVGAEEAAGVDHGEAVVRLGGEVDEHVDVLLGEQPLGRVEVADVADCEPHAEPVEVARVAGVGQLVERHDVVARVVFEPPADEVRADESGRAGDEDRSGHARIVPIPLGRNPASRCVAPGQGSLPACRCPGGRLRGGRGGLLGPAVVRADTLGALGRGVRAV